MVLWIGKSRAQAVDDPPIGNVRIWFVTPLTLKQPDDKEGAELPGHVEIAGQPLDGPGSDGRVG